MNPHRGLNLSRILSPLRLPFRHGPEEADSTGDTAILEAIQERDWERLGVLLGVHDQDLGEIVAAWGRTPREIRRAVAAIVTARKY